MIRWSSISMTSISIEPLVLGPSPKSEHIFDIAVPRDSALRVFPNKTLVLCEGTKRSALQRNGSTRFPVRGPRETRTQSRFRQGQWMKFFGLIDRDFLGTEEIREIRTKAPESARPRILFHGELSLSSREYVAEISGRIDSTKPSIARQFGENMMAVRDRLLVNLARNRNSYEISKELSRAPEGRGCPGSHRGGPVRKNSRSSIRSSNMKTNRPKGLSGGVQSATAGPCCRPSG